MTMKLITGFNKITILTNQVDISPWHRVMFGICTKVGTGVMSDVKYGVRREVRNNTINQQIKEMKS